MLNFQYRTRNGELRTGSSTFIIPSAGRRTGVRYSIFLRFSLRALRYYEIVVRSDHGPFTDDNFSKILRKSEEVDLPEYRKWSTETITPLSPEFIQVRTEYVHSVAALTRDLF